MWSNIDLTIYNPRGSENASDEGARQSKNSETLSKEEKAEIEKQILWEHQHLSNADIISFWFPKESLCAISLFELGMYMCNSSNYIVIGIEPGYKRAIDVKFKIEAIELFIPVVDSLEKLAKKIIEMKDDKQLEDISE